MSFTKMDTGFSEERYTFEGPDFGYLELAERVLEDTNRDVVQCATCGEDGMESYCVACVVLEFIQMASLAYLDQIEISRADLGEMTDTMGSGDGDVPDSIGGEDGDVPDSIGGEDDKDDREGDGWASANVVRVVGCRRTGCEEFSTKGQGGGHEGISYRCTEAE